jgi:iron complex outermembrane receptor protein
MAKTGGYKKRILMASVSIGAVVCMTGLHTALAQSGPDSTSSTPAAQSSTLGEIKVTARKRNESLLKVPVSIQAFTSKTLKRRGIYSIQDLSNQTPGLTEDNNVTTSGRNDRSFPTYTIRGIVPSITTNPTTSVFLDGAPIAGGVVDNLENLERVEVLKGPQSAYFGQDTFAGAISLITKDPAPRPQVTIDSLLAYKNWYDQNVTVEGPIIPGKLSIEGGFRYYSRQGDYKNKAVADKSPQPLGSQGTKSGNLKIVLTPNENLKISVLGLYFHDDDGPSAQALIYPSQSNCYGYWYCGTVPNYESGTQPATNDYVSPAVTRFLNFLSTPGSKQLFKPLKDNYGLARDAYHGSINVDYRLPNYGLTLSSITSADDQRFSELQDFFTNDGSQQPDYYYNFLGPGSTPFANTYHDDPFFVEQDYRDFAQELRLTSDPNQQFRYLVGADYEYTRVDTSLAGGGAFSYTSGDSPDYSNTFGIFYGLAYDFTPKVTLNFEGRLQLDEQGTTPFGTGTSINGSYRDFLPRVSLQYKFTPQVMAYATYSRGVNPGTFNGPLIALPPAISASIESTYDTQVKVAPEELTNYELGSKGSFFGDKLQISADVYYDIWYRQIVVNSISFYSGPTLENTSVDNNIAKTDLDGLEADILFEPIPGLVINGDGAINNTSIVKADCVTCGQVTGNTNPKGKKLPDVSLYQMALGAEYNGSLSFLQQTSLDGLKDWGYFARGDYIFKSPQFEDEDNLVSTPAANLINLRVGITHGPLTIEAFVDNLTDFQGPVSLEPFYGTNSLSESFTKYDALLGGLPFQRSFGLRLHYVFGL